MPTKLAGLGVELEHAEAKDMRSGVEICMLLLSEGAESLARSLRQTPIRRGSKLLSAATWPVTRKTAASHCRVDANRGCPCASNVMASNRPQEHDG